MVTLRYNASQVPALLGAFGSQRREEALRQLWRKADAQSYNDACARARVPTHASAEERGAAIIAQSTAASDALAVPIVDARALQTQKRAVFAAAAEHATSDIEREALRAAVERQSNTQYGTRKESDALQRYAAARDLSITRSERLWCKRYADASVDESLLIQGMVDGIVLDAETRKIASVVEIKNRAYKLFHTLRDYERMQLAIYLELCDAPRGVLVEAFQGKLDSVEIARDEDYFRNSILMPLHNVNARMQTLLQDATLQDALIRADGSFDV